MSAEFNIQQAFESLREEIQTDRIEMQKTITAGFTSMHEKFDEHSLSDTQKFTAIEGRLDAVEETASTAKRGFWWTIGTLITSVLGWIASQLNG